LNDFCHEIEERDEVSPAQRRPWTTNEEQFFPEIKTHQTRVFIIAFEYPISMGTQQAKPFSSDAISTSRSMVT
jgi:hypothetical protein